MGSSETVSQPQLRAKRGGFSRIICLECEFLGHEWPWGHEWPKNSHERQIILENLPIFVRNWGWETVELLPMFWKRIFTNSRNLKYSLFHVTLFYEFEGENFTFSEQLANLPDRWSCPRLIVQLLAFQKVINGLGPSIRNVNNIRWHSRYQKSTLESLRFQ